MSKVDHRLPLHLTAHHFEKVYTASRFSTEALGDSGEGLSGSYHIMLGPAMRSHEVFCQPYEIYCVVLD